MKKEYKKPMVRIERFDLSESIALGCELKSNHAMDVCAYEDNGWMTFSSAIKACVDAQIDQEDEKLCYHVPTEAYNIFTS